MWKPLRGRPLRWPHLSVQQLLNVFVDVRISDVDVDRSSFSVFSMVGLGISWLHLHFYFRMT